MNDEEKYLSIRRDLGLRQLVKRQEGDGGHQLEIHRSLQMNLLDGLAKNEDASLRATVCMEVIAMLNAVPPQASRLAQNEKKIWPEFTRYVPQVLALRRNSLCPEPPMDFDIEFAKMLSNIGCFLWHMGQIRECDLAMKTADEIIKKQPTSVGESAECKALISDIYLVTGRLADCIGVSRCGVSLEYRQVLLTLREEETGQHPSQRGNSRGSDPVGKPKRGPCLCLPATRPV